MIVCGNCGARYPSERLFCGKCKARLGIRCSYCGFVNLINDLFCGICLTDLKSQTAPPAPKSQAEPQTELHAKQVTSEPSKSKPPSIFEEIQQGAEDDEGSTKTNELVSQDEIEKMFQEDNEL